MPYVYSFPDMSKGLLRLHFFLMSGLDLSHEFVSPNDDACARIRP